MDDRDAGDFARYTLPPLYVSVSQHQEEVCSMLTIRTLVGPVTLVATLLAGSLTLAADAKKPVGTVTINETQFGLIVGGSTGGGILTFRHKRYPFKLSGLSLGANVGASKMNAKGEVYDLKNVSQFPGTYTKLDATVALGGGMGGIRLKNQNGVIMRLESRTKGLQLNLGMSGVTVTMGK